MRRRYACFFRYTLSPIFSSRCGTVTFPSVDAMITFFPEPDRPKSFERSTFIVRVVPSTVISTFFIVRSLHGSSLFSPLHCARQLWLGRRVARYVCRVLRSALDDDFYWRGAESGI